MSKKDWTGNKKSQFATLGASNHSEDERELYDFYATDPKAMELLLEKEQFSNVWEPACGKGHLSEVLKKHNILEKSTDIVNRGYGDGEFDFLGIENNQWHGDIITNPPFAYAQEFVERALLIMEEGKKLALFLRIQFLESQGRKNLFRNFPPKTVYVSSNRILCAKNGDFENNKENGSAACYCWFIWQKGYTGNTTLKWFN